MKKSTRRTQPVSNALGLQAIVDRVLSHKNIFWFVSRSGTIKQLTIYILNDSKHSGQSSRFYNCRFYEVSVDEVIINTGKKKSEKWIGSEGSGWMYDYYARSGHIFPDRSSAFKYLKERIDADKKTLVKTAKSTYDKYPEYHV